MFKGFVRNIRAHSALVAVILVTLVCSSMLGYLVFSTVGAVTFPCVGLFYGGALIFLRGSKDRELAFQRMQRNG